MGVRIRTGGVVDAGDVRLWRAATLRPRSRDRVLDRDRLRSGSSTRPVRSDALMGGLQVGRRVTVYFLEQLHIGVYRFRFGRFIVWAKRAVIPDVTLNAGPNTSANDEFALAA